MTLLFISGLAHATPPAWQTLAPGVQYHRKTLPLNRPHSYLHVFRIDLHKNHLQLAYAQDHYVSSSLVAHLADQHNAPLAVNGGFFTPKKKMLGLRISNHQQRNPIKFISWWGVFYIQDHQARIKKPRDFKTNENITFAIQAGPRLIINNRIPQLKPGFAERTAIGIDNQGFVIISVTEHAQLETQTLATLLQNPETYACVDAINLDGGSSTQLYANFPDLSINISNLSFVTDTVLVLPNPPNQQSAEPAYQSPTSLH